MRDAYIFKTGYARGSGLKKITAFIELRWPKYIKAETNLVAGCRTTVVYNDLSLGRITWLLSLS